MATFAKASFNTAVYNSFRPTYPAELFSHIYKFHAKADRVPKWELAVDLGCGTGQASTALLSSYAGQPSFKRVIGVDPSQGMIATATKSLPDEYKDRLQFFQGSAESVPFIKDSSVDLATSAQAIHWFDHQRLWNESCRILRQGGTAAFWVYSEFRLSKYPSLTPLITAYSQGEQNDPRTSLGPHWQRPGRSILENHLLDVPDAKSVAPSFGPTERVYFTGSHYPELPTPLPVIMHKTMSWDDLYSYLETWSSLHTYRSLYPDDIEDQGGIARRFWKELKEATAEEEMIDIEWPLALILAKRLS